MKKILVIDDDKDLAETIEELLSQQYTVAVETDNENVLQRYQEFKPDLIILDNSIGQRQAKDILADLQPHMLNTIPFVLFTGHPDISTIASSLNANGYLAKPFALNDLYTCVDNLLN